jgi:hypothetical protein
MRLRYVRLRYLRLLVRLHLHPRIRPLRVHRTLHVGKCICALIALRTRLCWAQVVRVPIRERISAHVRCLLVLLLALWQLVCWFGLVWSGSLAAELSFRRMYAEL